MKARTCARARVKGRKGTWEGGGPQRYWRGKLGSKIFVNGERRISLRRRGICTHVGVEWGCVEGDVDGIIPPRQAVRRQAGSKAALIE